MVFWITGITASGKTFLGKELLKSLKKHGFKSAIHLDGDELRKRSDWVSGHTLEARYKVLHSLVNLILEEKEFHDIIIVSTVSHVRDMRIYARKKIESFHEIYLDCPLSICESRDYKHIYSRMRVKSGSNAIFPGLTEQYQKSDNPELILKTGSETFRRSPDKLIEYALKAIKI